MFVAKAWFIHSVMFLTNYRFVKAFLYAALRLSPTPTLQRVGDSLSEATAAALTGY